MLKEKYPKLRVAGYYYPPIGFEADPEMLNEAIGAIRDAKPDICYVALGSPKQDIFNYRHYQETGVPVHIGIGISLNFVTGDVKRAPRWMQRVGLEWFYRLLREPWRWRRMLALPQAAWLVFWQRFRRSSVGER